MKTKLIKWPALWAGVVVGVCMFFTTGCVVREGVAYGPAPVGPYYNYYYYPDWGVYFYPEGHLYYWEEDGHWHSGERLPPRYHLHAERRENLRLHTREPWTEHHEERHREYHGEQHHEHEHEH